jgi:hypothetical protein
VCFMGAPFPQCIMKKAACSNTFDLLKYPWTLPWKSYGILFSML